MAISFDNALGVHPAALALRAQRAGIIANNIANADTPNFKARDLPFETILAETTRPGGSVETMRVTRPNHIQACDSAGGDADLLFRSALMPSIDGNTVDVHVEQAAMAENNMQLQASMQFLSSRFKGLIAAIRGE
jgi:flagellar basal-body rod protein FlgB